MAILLCAVGLIDLFLLIVLAKNWRKINHIGRVTLAGAVFALIPIAWGSGVMMHGIHQMTSVEFCGSCHVMEDYVAGLHIDDPDSLPAVHYQNNYVPQKTACYDCHTEYSMFGDVKAKFNGLKHVWVNYVTGPPDELAVYQPYRNVECMRCHGNSKAWRESEDHVDWMAEMESEETSCLECHDTVHVKP